MQAENKSPCLQSSSEGISPGVDQHQLAGPAVVRPRQLQHSHAQVPPQCLLLRSHCSGTQHTCVSRQPSCLILTRKRKNPSTPCLRCFPSIQGGVLKSDAPFSHFRSALQVTGALWNGLQKGKLDNWHRQTQRHRQRGAKVDAGVGHTCSFRCSARRQGSTRSTFWGSATCGMRSPWHGLSCRQSHLSPACSQNTGILTQSSCTVGSLAPSYSPQEVCASVPTLDSSSAERNVLKPESIMPTYACVRQYWRPLQCLSWATPSADVLFETPERRLLWERDSWTGSRNGASHRGPGGGFRVGRGWITLGLKAAGSLTIMNWRALNTALSVSVRFSQSWHMHASLQKSPARTLRTPQQCTQGQTSPAGHWWPPCSSIHAAGMQVCTLKSSRTDPWLRCWHAGCHMWMIREGRLYSESCGLIILKCEWAHVK